MKRVAILTAVLALSTLAFGCSRTLSGKYFHDFGPNREFVELKSDKTITIYVESYKDDKRSREKWTETGTYTIEDNVLKSHSTVTFTYPDQTSNTQTHDWEWLIEEGSLVKRPDGSRYRPESLLSTENAATKLTPELTKDKAQEAIDKWAIPHMNDRKDGKVAAEYKGPVEIIQSQDERDEPGVFVWQLNEQSQGHIARAQLQFRKFPTAYAPLPSLGDPYIPTNPSNPSLSTGSPKGGKGLLTTMGNATFYHDSDGKWTLIGVEAIASEAFTRFWNMHQMGLSIEIK